MFANVGNEINSKTDEIYNEEKKIDGEEEKIIQKESVLGVRQTRIRLEYLLRLHVLPQTKHEQVYGLEKRAENGRRQPAKEI